MTLGEFVFIMHDGGRGGSFLFKDIALARYREQVTDDTRRLTATHPPPAPVRWCSTPRHTAATR